ncbi:MAG: transcriptional regulator [Herbinix sp.]|jgi:ArsR family transcriptional regulator|nr:transcriptional regulator [Herbinix sp.]
MCDETKKLKEDFKACRKVLNAVGDEVRQHLLCIMMESSCNGSRVIDIADKTHLSRPAVSHHMQILKDAGIVKSRKEGTCIYYYLDPDDNELDRLESLVADIKKIMKTAPDRSGE